MERTNVKFFALCIAIFALLSTSSAEIKPAKGSRPPGCFPGLIIDCAIDFEDIVWGTVDDYTCNVSVNRCLFNTQNCFRYNNGQPLVKEISKSECQKLCKNGCQRGGERVCARRGDNLCYFPDKCAMETYVCEQGQIWRNELNRFCDESSSISTCPF